MAALAGSLLLAGGLFYLYKTIDIPDPNKDFRTQTSFVYYAGGKTQLGQYATQNRDSIPLKEIPQKMQDAVVAAENQSFWTDKGIDPKGILRAAFSNARGNSKQGASTITQQYVKILYLTQERSYKRKVKEAILSLKIQQQLSKSEILEGYLNTIYFGRGAYGVQAAARAYFDKDAKDLSLKECAVLASVLNNPTLFDPANGKDAKANLKERYAYVLGGMAHMGNISADQADRAERHLPDFPEIEAQSQYGGQKGFMLAMVRDELHSLGYTDEQIEGGGLRVTTTFTPKAMEAAKQGVMEARPDGFSDKQLHVAVASVEPGTGALRGFYGGQDYLQSQINWAETGGAPGSSFKPFALAAALKAGFSLKDTFEGNSPYYYNGQDTGDRVRNEGTGPDGLGNDYGSAVNLITATEESINTAYADLTVSIPDGPDKILETANDLGIPKWDKKASGYNHLDNSPGLEPVTGIALGSATVAPINMANAYATIANGGQRADVHVIDKVVNKSGETEWSYKQSTKDVLSEDIAADTSYALQQVVQHGTGTAALGLGRPAAGKTGTATNGDDDVSSAWFVGYTPQLSTAVMYVRGKGNEQLDGWLPSYFGADYPADTWTAVMKRDMEGLAVEDFPPPANVDGTAPATGHEPYTPPPSPTQAPPTRSPSQTPSSSPSDSSTVKPTPPGQTNTHPPSPSDPCGVLGCPSDSPSDSTSSSPTQSPSQPGKPSKSPRTMASTEPRRYSGQ
ncbi:transglycosylase domain-containing protein [Nocardioides koreensis]|uniref:transglycosylase domain-containing protein n=1 Tax=Nocardioides koreensis TaxID=433651 RepID=UPI0031D3C041